MNATLIIIAGIFIPLFPLSMVFNVALARVRHPIARGMLFLAWPQLGLALIHAAHVTVPPWVIVWALATSLLYALRALALREVGLWAGFIATSAFALLWLPVAHGAASTPLEFYALAFSTPFVLLAILAAGLEHRFGAAYTGLYGGLACTLPRFSGVLVPVVLAAIGTPLFPAFFAMLAVFLTTTPAAATALAAVWLLWSWAGTRLLQGLVSGPAEPAEAQDLSLGSTWTYAAVLVVLVIGGFYLSAQLAGAAA